MKRASTEALGWKALGSETTARFAAARWLAAQGLDCSSFLDCARSRRSRSKIEVCPETAASCRELDRRELKIAGQRSGLANLVLWDLGGVRFGLGWWSGVADSGLATAQQWLVGAHRRLDVARRRGKAPSLLLKVRSRGGVLGKSPDKDKSSPVGVSSNLPGLLMLVSAEERERERRREIEEEWRGCEIKF
ncbi:L-lactate transporter [Striga asiatica]|uniref:L-lactate transporter n=1 Tax=Striga asiatica TaxID=4170 RepID=A0A5A7Q2N6_STRAF|nr:L-lactate transporter [Striga asiatica]